jgi:pyruvate/2-oxoglutarate dehydrogenase complex dihydrolipoamide acyltransferase (E2) component
MIGYNPIYEYAALPDVERIIAAIKRSIATKHERAAVAGIGDSGPVKAEDEVALPGSSIPATDEAAERHVQSITVPVMGEGIRSAKIVSLLKNRGDAVELDDELCEVETDKAVYPIQSSFAGVMGEWKTKVGDTVEIGQELGTIIIREPSFADQFETTAKDASVAAGVDRGRSISDAQFTRPGSAPPATVIEPALSPTITRKLSRVIPANLQIDVRWDAIREARDATKKANGKDGPSPSVMIAWSVVRAMEKHAPFRRLILEDDQIVQNDDFELGVAVALEGDRLATAVIPNANTKSWPEFVRAYNESIAATRRGRVDAMNAPVVITSLGAFGVKAGAPIVVPPSVATLFAGTAHRELIPNKNKDKTAEVITLSLTFDHRVVNGARAAAFANEIKNEIEGFKIPDPEKQATSV